MIETRNDEFLSENKTAIQRHTERGKDARENNKDKKTLEERYIEADE